VAFGGNRGRTGHHARGALSARLLAERGVKADTSMLSRFFIGEGISFKKTVLPSEQDRRDVARRRTSWKALSGKA
jgi:transposase